MDTPLSPSPGPLPEHEPEPARDARPRLGVGTIAGVTALYLAALAVATYPAALEFTTRLAPTDIIDPLQHLCTMRWYRSCLAEGRAPFLTPALQYPTGSPLGLYSPLQLQGLLYLAGSCLTTNDVAIYNGILAAEFLFTGLGTFAFAWWLLRSRAGAAFAGLAAMLSGPMLFGLRSGGTELLTIGGFPLFLLGWLRFLDAPSRGRLAGAVGLFALLCNCAPYYGILGAFPAALYVAWMTLAAGPGWLRARLGWLAAFGAAAGAAALLAFPNQLWAVAHGYPMARSREHFLQYNSTPWNYVFPTPEHALASALLPGDWSWQGTEVLLSPTQYLGATTLLLVAVALAARGRLPRVPLAGFLWASFGLLFLLSLGASVTILGRKVPLPGIWLWDHVPGFRALRVPARYGYFGSVCLAVLAGGTLAGLLARIRRPAPRGLALAAVLAITVADLANRYVAPQPIPPMPATYREFLREHPGARLLELHGGSSLGHLRFESTLAYWQSHHRARTSAGNPGVENIPFEQGVQAASPFAYHRLQDPDYLCAPGPQRYDVGDAVAFEDHAWLFLAHHGYDYLVLHRWTWPDIPPLRALGPIRDRLAAGIVAEDADVVIIDPRRLPPPARPVALPADGWRNRFAWQPGLVAAVEKEADLVVYTPPACGPIRLTVDGVAHHAPREVEVVADGQAVARWAFDPLRPASHTTPPLDLPPGWHRLRLRSNGDHSSRRLRENPAFRDQIIRFSLAVSRFRVEPDRALAGRRDGPESAAR